MKLLFTLAAFIFFTTAFSQTLQLHYDPRHKIDPDHNAKNFLTLYFEYFKSQDSGKGFIKPGSFLLKMQSDFLGEKNNIGKFYIQVSQSFRFWKPKIFINLQYSGGLGITEPREYSYYIINAYSAGLTYPFQWNNAYLSAVLNYKYIPFKKPSKDVFFTLYWWKGLFNYKGEFLGDFSIWTENKNHGDAYTQNLHGKRFTFFAEPQFWYNINKTLAIGTKINTNYHVLTYDDLFQVYPTIGVKLKI